MPIMQPNTTRRRAVLTAAAALAATAVAAPAAADPAAQPVRLSPPIAAAPNELTVDVDPAAQAAAGVAGVGTAPASIGLALPRGMKLDLRSRARVCTASQAQALACPASSSIGFGHAVVHVAGYLEPGGETDLVGYIHAFLGAPTVAGDPASVVLEVELLGVDRIQQAVRQSFGVALRFETYVLGRVVRQGSGPYGLALRFDGLPGWAAVPPALAQQGLSVQLTRLKLQLGAVRFVRVPFVHVYRVQTMGGPRRLRVRDHSLVAHYLLSNPPVCHGSWPFQLQLPSAAGSTEQSLVSRVRCGRGPIPLAPPPSPSAPQRA